MIAGTTLSFLSLAFLSSILWAQEGPNRPQPKPISVEVKTTAILVLDLSARCHNPEEICSKLTPRVGEFLERARAASVPILYTVSVSAKGTPLGEVAAPLKRRQDEPIVYAEGFDKFAGGELQELLRQRGIKRLIIVGASTNIAVLYTTTTAARIHRYNIIIPMDGMIAQTNYEQEYTFHQFTVLASRANELFQFTQLSMISFQ